MLVVDDTDNILNLVVEILEAANFHVVRANSGAGAVKLAANYSSKIDLLLSDVNMPEMSGPKPADALKEALPDIHVMFMSGCSGGDLMVLNRRVITVLIRAGITVQSRRTAPAVLTLF